MHIALERSSPLPLWGGTECTVNRVGDLYCDQTARTGHAVRLDDLDRFAALGFKTLRYPLLWERTAPGRPQDADWRWTDARTRRLQALGINCIAGLVHHGSGPRDTSLISRDWSARVAVYAGAVARRYPWINDWTPVNEPLTTARFSGLYGHWYPHQQSDIAFARALINQLTATVLAMRAIREANPFARLIQTEDLTYVRATPTLQYQADFENERRWLTFDILTGKLDRTAPLYDWLRRAGISACELNWFVDNPCPPDILGANYYVVSERFLDDQYVAADQSGGNGIHRYADLDAARSCGLVGLAALLGQAYERFKLPMAVTEAHMAGTRDEQLRWLVEMWDQAHAAAAAGVEMRGVTIWSLLGSWDWDSLCTAERGRYEPGVFDIRGPEPRPTALAGAVRTLLAGRRPEHPVLASPGWWRQ